MQSISVNLLEELIKILESPQSLKSEHRFKLLERAYLERFQNNPTNGKFFKKSSK